MRVLALHTLQSQFHSPLFFYRLFSSVTMFANWQPESYLDNGIGTIINHAHWLANFLSDATTFLFSTSRFIFENKKSELQYSFESIAFLNVYVFSFCFQWVEESFTNFDKGINWRSYVVCDVAYNNVNNWLWTPFIERGPANRMYIEIKFTTRDCSLFPGNALSCKETFSLLYYEFDAATKEPPPWEPDSYKLIGEKPLQEIQIKKSSRTENF